MTQSLKLRLGVLFLSFALVGCGFQLRGTESAMSLPEPYAVQVKSSYPRLNQLFEQELNSQGYTVVRANPDYLIQVQNEFSTMYEFSFNTEFDQPFKQLHYRLTYTISDSQGEVIADLPELELKNDFFNPSGSYLQQAVAEDLALDQIRKKAVREIGNILRLKIANRTGG